MNASSGLKFAVDVPSGISADSGMVLGTAFRADITVTFQKKKTGLMLSPGRSYAGSVIPWEIGISTDPVCHEGIYLMDRKDYQAMLPVRSEDSHKGTFGKLLIIAGSKGMSGAAYLNAMAAYLSGAGLVQIYTEETNREILQTLAPEAIVSTYRSYEQQKASGTVILGGRGLYRIRDRHLGSVGKDPEIDAGERKGSLCY